MRLKKKSKPNGSALVIVVIVVLALALAGAGWLSMTRTDLRREGTDYQIAELQNELEKAVSLALFHIHEAYQDSSIVKIEPDIAVLYTDLPPHDPENAYPWAEFDDERYFIRDYEIPERNFKVRVKIIEDRRNQNADPKCVDGWCRIGDQSVKSIRLQAGVENELSGQFRGYERRILVERSSFATYFAFWEEDLQIDPGSCVIIDGGPDKAKIHTNGNFFLAEPWAGGTCDNGDPYGTYLKDVRVSALGYIVRQSFDKPRNNNRKVVINGKELGREQDIINILGDDPNVDAPDNDPNSGFKGLHTKAIYDEDGNPTFVDPTTWEENPNWEDFREENWGDEVLDGVEGRDGPDIATLEPGGPHSTDADIRIVMESDGTTINVYRHGETFPNASLKDACGITDASGNTNDREFHEGRESMTVEALEIDVQGLTSSGCLGTNSGGVVYAHRKDARPDADPVDTIPDPNRVPNGFILKNAETLNQPLSFITPQPVYLHGSFNRDDVDGSGNELWKPALIIADTVNFLSKDFPFDPNAPSKLPKAASDEVNEYNAAFIYGQRNHRVFENGGSINSVGLPAFIRMLEDWGDSTFKSRGAYINLWQSQYATSNFTGAHFNEARTMDWQHDNRLISPDNQPPGDFLGLDEGFELRGGIRDISREELYETPETFPEDPLT